MTKTYPDFQFGPRTDATGRTVFRLWAPSARSVALEVRRQSGETTDHPMVAREDTGWYDSPSLALPPGTRYGFRINDSLLVPDPASRMQDDDVHGMSVLVASSEHDSARSDLAGSPARRSTSSEHRGRPWEETVIYEAHVGTITTEGTFRSLIPRLDALAELGITTIELLPIADFPGRHNWGYDGVLPFAPDRSYGTPEEFRALVAAAHHLGIEVWMDVVYNHFGPDGNYLHLYAAPFFSQSVVTPWGAGIDFSVPEVRRFFIENALYWLHEYELDGLRLDAVHAITDHSSPHFLVELARTVRDSLGPDREAHLVLENEANEARFLRAPAAYHAQWNDDIHHALHVLLTGETSGYYRDFAEDPEGKLLRALTTGFIYQGEASQVHDGAPRGEPSGDLSPVRFISFLQNHDQIGNRAWGERLTALAGAPAIAAAQALLLLAPQIPMLFMGEEWQSATPFLFFCDFDDELADAVRAGRRREFDLDDLPDPGAPKTLATSRPGAPGDVSFVRSLLALRTAHLVPLLASLAPGKGVGGGDHALAVRYSGDGAIWCIDVNLSKTSRPRPLSRSGAEVLVFRYPEAGSHNGEMLPWSIDVYKEPS